ncbi:MAG TPA: HAMP domain-containing protein, partial [bacterium]
MPEQNFHAVQRLREFWTILKSPGFRSKTTLFLFATWLISILLILLSPNLNFGLLLHALHLFLLFKLTQNIDRNLRPQPELLLPFFFLFFLLEIGLLKAVYAIASPPEAVPGFFFTGLQGFVLAALLLIFSLLLVQNIRTSFWSFLLMFLLTYILLNLVDNEGFFYHILIQIILVIFLLRRTAWLELLTKNECWLYLFLLFLSFWAFSDLNPFADPTVSRYQEATIWFGLPKILYLGFKMYLLALLVKIPVVLVYNFASLSRKLKISSLFQSTFPQLIQLCMLLLMFYFFLAGWQAEKVRMAIIAKIEEIGSGSGHREIPIFKFPVSSSDWTLSLKGYQPIQFRKTLPDQGVLTIPRLSSPATANAADGDYFIFFESREADTLRYLNIVKLDSMFLQALSERTSILAGSLLQAYPYQPPLWESYLYDFSFLKDESRFWIFPFGVIPARPDWSVSCALVKESETSPEWARNLDQKILRHIQMNVGRVVSPLLAADMSRAGLFAFDIILTPRAAFFTTSMLSYILLLIVVYLLVNALVIGRMAKFGEEINQMIVQKFNQLKSGIREIATGNLDYQVKIEGRDEFVELADRFNTMGVQLKESIAKAREKERLEHELAIARQVQRDLLPRTLPNIPGFRVAAALKTANEVGGDFYDLLALDDHLFLFTIGDVSGKGTSAAFYMAQCISLIRFSPQFT